MHMRDQRQRDRLIPGERIIVKVRTRGLLQKARDGRIYKIARALFGGSTA